MGNERAKAKAIRPAAPSPKPASPAVSTPVVAEARPGNALAALVHALDTERGEPLADAAAWSRRLGADVTMARIVQSIAAAQAADAIDARAFTVGHRIFFARDEGPADTALLGHELTHVVQQRDARPPAAWTDLPIIGPSDPREVAARHENVSSASGEMAIARAYNTTPVTAEEYLDGLVLHSAFTHVFDHWFDTDGPKQDIWFSDAVAKGPFGKYLVRRRADFMSTLEGTWFFDSWCRARLASMVAPETPAEIVDRVRVMKWDLPEGSTQPVKTNTGSAGASQDPAAFALANAAAANYFKSIEKLFPRFAAALVQKNPVKSAPFVKVETSDVLVGHPMDVLVLDVLLDRQWNLYDPAFAAVAAGDVPYTAFERPKESLFVELEFGPNGLWHWVTAKPEDATREQVATVLFGRPEQAYRLIDMRPLWGFRTRDVGAFTLDMFGKLQMKGIEQKQLVPWNNDIDPVAELAASYGERDAEKRFSAGKVTEPHDESNVIDLEVSMIGSLDKLAALVVLFGQPTTAIDAARDRFTARRDRASNQSLIDVASMYAFAHEQRSILNSIGIGIGNAGLRLFSSGKQFAPDSIRLPLRDLVVAYLAVLSAIELPELARPRLVEADELARNIDITISEASIAERASELEGEIVESNNDPDAPSDWIEHDLKSQDYLGELADLRVTMRTDPKAAQTGIAKLAPKVDELGFDIGLKEKLARLHMTWTLINKEEDLWESAGDRRDGAKLKETSERLYQQFFWKVWVPYQFASDDKTRLAIRQTYADLANSKEMVEHLGKVYSFITDVEKHKRWAKLIVGLVIAFVAFGLGQWEYGAVIAGGGTMFEAAISAGALTTLSSVALNKIILNENPTIIGVVGGFLGNAGTFFVAAKWAAAIKAAGTEIAAIEGAAAAGKEAFTAVEAGAAAEKMGRLARVAGAGGKVGMFVGMNAFGFAVGLAQAEVEKLASKEHRLLTASEIGEVGVQAFISVVAMHIFGAITPKDLFEFRTPEQKLAIELASIKNQRDALLAKTIETFVNADLSELKPGQAIPVPDEAALKDLLADYNALDARRAKFLDKLLAYAERNPGKFTPDEIAAMRNKQPEPVLARQIREVQLALAVEQEGPTDLSCAAGWLDTLIAHQESLGNKITRVATNERTGQRTITITPSDPTSPSFTVTERVAPPGQRVAPKVPAGSARHFERWLDARDRPLMSVEGQDQLRELYARDPVAAINLASEKYGYLPASESTPNLAVRPDAPGGMEPFVSPAEHDTAVKLGRSAPLSHEVVAIGENRYLAAPGDLRSLRAGTPKDAHPSEIKYDPDTHTSSFERDVDGKRVRIEAKLPPPLLSFGEAMKSNNRVLGGPITEAKGEEIMRAIAAGDHTKLADTGLTGEAVRPDQRVEFGLAEFDGGYLIIIGEPNAVNWAELPGLKPRGHTHPLHPGNDLPPDAQGRRQIPIAEIEAPTTDRHTHRELVFPSVPDYITMGLLRIGGHRVFTGFVVDNGVVRKPIAGETLPRLELVMGDTVLVGQLADGSLVYESTVEGKAGTETPISKRKIWAVEPHGANEGGLYMSEPEGVQPVTEIPERARPVETQAAMSREMKQLAKTYGEAVVKWAIGANDAAQATRLVKLDPGLRTKLMWLSAQSAFELVTDLGEARLKKALAGDQISAVDLFELRTKLGKDELVARLDAAGSDPVARSRIAQRAALERTVIGQPLDAKMRKILTDQFGYSVGKDDVIYRKGDKVNALEPLTRRSDKIVIADAESAAEVQARVYESLPANKKAQFDAMVAAAPDGTKVLLVEGVFDTGATWAEVFAASPGKKAALERLLTSKRGGGLSKTEAQRLINGLTDRADTLKVVIGTDTVRTAEKYRPDNAGDAEAHHFDPLFLGGGHELILLLAQDPHDVVHAFFDELELPSSSKLGRVRMQPNSLQAKIRADAKPAVVVVKGKTVSYQLLDTTWKL